MVLVLCLTTIGIGYSHWSKTLYIDGVVYTGTFDAELSVGDIWDNETDKNVGEVFYDIMGPDTVLIGIDNAYPSYEGWFELDVHCLGTVPLHINNVVVDADPFLDVEVLGMDQLPIQLHECDYHWFAVRIHVLQNHPETGELLPTDAKLGAAITITVDQFNHDPV
jgi:hypothetical protein